MQQEKLYKYGVFDFSLEDVITKQQLEATIASDVMVLGVTACTTTAKDGKLQHQTVTKGSPIADEAHRNQDSITPETAFITGSNGKMIAAATLLRMMEHEDYKHHFPSGIDTKLSDFIGHLY